MSYLKRYDIVFSSHQSISVPENAEILDAVLAGGGYPAIIYNDPQEGYSTKSLVVHVIECNKYSHVPSPNIGYKLKFLNTILDVSRQYPPVYAVFIEVPE